MPTVAFDTLIIGGGIIGSSIAYHLARAGARVLVVERSAVAVSPAASWASAGGVRRQGRHPAEAALASEAIARWPTLERELEVDVQYRQGGNLLLAEGEAEAEALIAFMEAQRTMGFADVRLVDGDEARALVPGLAPGITAGSFSPADGQADPASATRAFAVAAQRHGATYWITTECVALVVAGERVVGVRTERGEVAAGSVVLAAGAWSDTLMAPLGVRLPIRTRALQMVRSTPAPRDLLRPVLGSVSRPLSLKQLDDGSFLLGGGWRGEVAPDRRGYRVQPEHEQGNWQTACAVLPAVREQRIARSWCGLEAESFDEMPFIGPCPGRSALTLALGFSGHGFAIAPAVGRAVADLVLGRSAPELAGLDPSRMLGYDGAKVDAFLAEDD